MTIKMESGSANGQIDLVAKFANFVATELTGMWTLVEHVTPGGLAGFASDSQATVRMVAPNDGVYYHFTSMMTNTRPRMRLLASTAFSAGVAGLDQPVGLCATGNSRNRGPSIPKTDVTFTYFFIAGPTYIYCVAKFAGGEYQHWDMGKADNYPGVNNGYWFTACTAQHRWASDRGDWSYLGDSFSESSYFQLFNGGVYTQTGETCHVGAMLLHDGTWAQITPDATSSGNNTVFPSFARNGKVQSSAELPMTSSNLIVVSPDVVSNHANIVTPLIPGYFIAPKIGRVGWYTLQGAIPGARACWTEGYEEDEEITVGTQVWKIFPVWKSRRSTFQPFARFLGMAVLIDEGV